MITFFLKQNAINITLWSGSYADSGTLGQTWTGNNNMGTM